MSKIISFDFDNTLARISVQTFALKVKQIGYPSSKIKEILNDT